MVLRYTTPTSEAEQKLNISLIGENNNQREVGGDVRTARRVTLWVSTVLYSNVFLSSG